MSILPIVTYDDPVLRKPADPIDPEYPGLQAFIDDLFDTMYNADGIGLAAPQVGRSIKLFVVDADVLIENEGETAFGAGVFINPEMEGLDEDYWEAEEGCLSLPDVQEQVARPWKIRIRYFDREFQFHDEVHEGWYARVLQHEVDHLKGILFIDYLGAFRKRLLKSNLEKIKNGEMDTEYSLAAKYRSRS